MKKTILLWVLTAGLGLGLGAEEFHQVVVVGAGLSGLTAAWYLRSHDVLVLEKQNPPASGSGETTQALVEFDVSANRLGPPAGALFRLLQDFQIKLDEIPAPVDAIWDRGQAWLGPTGWENWAAASAPVLRGVATRVHAALAEYRDLPDFVPTAQLKALDRLTARQWFDQEQLPLAIQDHFNVLSRGHLSANIDEVSALSFLAGLGGRLEQNSSTGTPDDRPLRFREGPGQLARTLVEHLATSIRYRQTVTQVRVQGNDFVVQVSSPQGSQVLLAAVVILAVPAPEAATIAASALTPDQKKLLETIPYSSFATVRLSESEMPWKQSYCLNLPPGHLTTQAYNPAYSTSALRLMSRNQDIGRTEFILSPTASTELAWLAQPDRDLIHRLSTDWQAVFPESRVNFDQAVLERHPLARPVFTPGAYQRLAQLNYINQRPLLLAGDYLIAPSLAGAAEAGRIAADKALDYLE